MRKILIIIILLCSLGFYIAHSKEAFKVNLKLEDQIGVVFLNKDMMLIIDDEDKATLLVLNEGSTTNLKKFYYRHLKVLMVKEKLINIDGINEDIFRDEEEIDDVKYTFRDGLIRINYEDSNLCINMDKNINISDCQFVYFYNTTISNVDFSHFNEIVLYHYKNPLRSNLLEEICEQAIDTYQLRDDEITIIKLSKDDYDVIVIKNE